MSGGRDLVDENDLTTIRDPVEDRLTLAEKNERLQSQLKVFNSFFFFYTKTLKILTHFDLKNQYFDLKILIFYRCLPSTNISLA